MDFTLRFRAAPRVLVKLLLENTGDFPTQVCVSYGLSSDALFSCASGEYYADSSVYHILEMNRFSQYVASPIAKILSQTTLGLLMSKVTESADPVHQSVVIYIDDPGVIPKPPSPPRTTGFPKSSSPNLDELFGNFPGGKKRNVVPGDIFPEPHTTGSTPSYRSHL